MPHNTDSCRSPWGGASAGEKRDLRATGTEDAQAAGSGNVLAPRLALSERPRETLVDGSGKSNDAARSAKASGSQQKPRFLMTKEAEGKGFEPLDALRRLRFSRPVQSATLPPLRIAVLLGYFADYRFLRETGHSSLYYRVYYRYTVG